MKRVFTKTMGGLISTAGGIVTEPNVDEWVPQEDIWIIGVAISTEILYAITVNGSVHGYLEVSQAGYQTADGAIFGVQTVGMQWTNGGTGKQSDCVVMMLPEGHGVPVREDGHVNLHGQVEAPAGETANLYSWIIIYYLRQKVN